MDYEHANAVNRAIRSLSLRHRARAGSLLASLGLHPGQEVLLLELARRGPTIQAKLSDALACEPPSVTLMSRKLEAAGHIRRVSDASDGRASVVQLTRDGEAMVEQIKELWLTLAEETVAGLPAETTARLPTLLETLAGNVDTRRNRRSEARESDLPADGVPVSEEPAALTGDYEPSALGWVREHVEQITSTGTTVGVTMSGRSLVLMTYQGAKTGKLRKTPLIRVERDGRYAAIASKGGEPTNPHWYVSVAAAPIIELQDGIRTKRYRAREIFDDEKELWWRRAVDTFPDYADYQRRTERQIPVLLLEPA